MAGKNVSCSVKVVEVLGHFLNLGVEMLLDLLDEAGVGGADEVDGGTLATVAASATDSVDVVLLLEGELVVDDEADLLHVDASGEEVGGDQDAGGAGTELLHDHVASHLVHLSVHDGDAEVVLLHLFCELNDSLLGVAIDEGLVDVEVAVQVEEHVHLPLLLLYGDVVLLDTFEGELLVLDQNLGGLPHEVLGQLQDVEGHRGGEEGDLDLAGEVLEDVLDLLLEPAREHLVGLVEHEDLQVVALEEALLHHVMDAPGGADHDVDALLEDLDLVADDGAADAGVDLDADKLTDLLHDEGDLLGQLSGGGDHEGLGVDGRSVHDLQN